MNWEMWYHYAGNDWFSRAGMIYPAVWGFVCFWVFALGACFGSFLNVCVWRIPRGQSLCREASHCTSCGSPIRWYDNLPVLSFLILRGRCRRCHSTYSSSYFWVELLCGILFVLALLKTGLSRQTVALLIGQWMTVFFAVGIALIDLRHRIIPDKMSLPMSALGLGTALLLPQAWGTDSRWMAPGLSAASGIIPATILLVFALVGRLFCRRTVIGMGDVKFMLGIGCLLGLPGGMFTLLAGSAAGCVAGLVTGRKPGDLIAFGPFLALGALVWVFADIYLLDFYHRLCVAI